MSAAAADQPDDPRAQLDRLARRYARERAIREEAERLLETKSLELYEVNRRLSEANTRLEQRVRQTEEGMRLAAHRLARVEGRCPVTALRLRQAIPPALRAADTSLMARGSLLALLLIDIDRFGDINLTHGEGVGDAVLVTVATRLAAAAGPTARLFRAGDDEFALLTTVPGLPRHAHALAESCIAALSPPIEIGGTHLQISVTIGVALSDFSEPALALLPAASSALRTARAAHKPVHLHTQGAACAEDARGRYPEAGATALA